MTTQMRTTDRAADVLIVSCFGRGNWLSSELAASGLNVTLVDVSSRLGRWTPEDREGPFGFFSTEKLKTSQLARLSEEDYADSVEQGFTAWLPNGPIDLKSSLTPHLLTQNGLNVECETFISRWTDFSSAERQAWIDKISSWQFSQGWVVHMAHHLASQVFTDNTDAIFHGQPLPLFSSFSIRRVTRRGYAKALDWCRSRGVRVLQEAHLTDLQLEGRRFYSLEITSEISGALRAPQVVWALTGKETEFVNEKLAKQLYPRGTVDYTWSWLRFRVQAEVGDFLKVLPLNFLLVQNLDLPWSHENLLWVQRTVNSTDFDVWILAPSMHRFQRTYIENMGEKIVEQFHKRIPQSQPKVTEYPQDYHYNYDELGPSRFGKFETLGFQKLAHLAVKNIYQNIYFDSPEQWGNVSWSGQFYAQEKLAKVLIDRDRTRKEREKGKEGAQL